MKPLRVAPGVVAVTLALACLLAWSPGVATARIAAAGAPAADAAGHRTAPNTSRNWWFVARGGTAAGHPERGRPAAASLRGHLDRWPPQRVVYLTFDEADEHGTTGRIIGILGRAT